MVDSKIVMIIIIIKIIIVIIIIIIIIIIIKGLFQRPTQKACARYTKYNSYHNVL